MRLWLTLLNACGSDSVALGNKILMEKRKKYRMQGEILLNLVMVLTPADVRRMKATGLGELRSI